MQAPLLLLFSVASASFFLGNCLTWQEELRILIASVNVTEELAEHVRNMSIILSENGK